MAREMKHSGIEWIGEIPKEWKVIRGKYLFNVLNGFAFDSSLFTNENTYTPLIRIRDISNYETEAYYMGDYSLDYVVKKGDVLVGMDGDFNVAKWKGRDAILNQRVCKLHSFTDNYLPQYAYYVLPMLLKGKNDVTYATTVKHLSSNDIQNFSYLVPSLSEQQKIANYLDKVCGEVDEMIALQEQMIEELKAYKQSVITEAVTKGLNPDAPMKDSGIDWIKELPENWEVVTPKALFSLRREKAIEGERQLTASQQFGVIYQDEYMQLTGTKVVTVMKDFDILKHVEAGDFVISMRSFQGGLEYSENTGSISSAYVMLIPNLEYVHPKFYRWLFKSVCYINALQSTSNMVRDGQAMRYSNFAQVPLYIVPLKEQQSIASYLDTKCAEIDALIAIKQAKIEELKDYKKSIIYEYVTGKKEVV